MKKYTCIICLSVLMLMLTGCGSNSISRNNVPNAQSDIKKWTDSLIQQ